ncbi:MULTISPECIES: potassium channel family protein [Halorubrum]|uniref:Trk K+ transport system, NAD-binding component n=1 Tax=Halorubrum sodomense TaxID=35743 RepID=A0A1I6FLX2_HALSD|nr:MULTISPECIES: NAD-binding protein [Halorubrum]TKX54583.1 TrkA family potassium uptake protein [Halorubrum sp. SP3]TKX67884.1 TrkA family potassium uptake protein [Halorubrum sp. SP9]SFR30888.1 Trk K+ transport system, NAD-binding component [Halorubrum sodomense]
MDTWKRRVVLYAVFLGAMLTFTAVVYRWGMRVFEEDPRTLIESFQFAIEMFTTTGFGGDASSWQSQQMHAFVAVMDLVGMVLLIGALPVVATPLLESAFATTVPRSLEREMAGHVVVASDTTRSDALLDEFESEDVPYVVVEPDPDRASALYEAGHTVIRADPETTEGLSNARLPAARALLTDVSDRVDASIVLASKELSTDVRAISVVEDPSRERYHRLAGADEVFSPRSLLGESLASKVTTAVRTDLDEAVAIGDSLRIAEVSIHHGSGLAGSTLAGSRIGERTGVDVIGAWFNGSFEAAPPPDATLSAGTVLLVSGTESQVERLVDLTNSAARRFGAGETVVIGHGQVGETVANALEDAGLPVVVVDRDGGDAIDVVGDATDPETLRDAGVADARTVVLALPDDTTAEFATLVVRDLAPNVEVLARVEDPESVPKMHRAGADYVLSLATVTGRMSASAVLADRDVLSLDTHVEVVRSEAPSLAGRTVGEASVREVTGCTVIAIERGDDLVTDVGPETRIERGDELVVAGTDDGVRAFERAFA